MEQLDIFADSHDVILRNDVVDALLRRMPEAARAACQALAAEYPDDKALASFTVLAATLEADSREPFRDHAALAAAMCELEERIAPAAQRALPAAKVHAWLAPCWGSLAQRASVLLFRPENSDCHAVPLWLRAGDWDRARAGVEGIASWWRIPAPLEWMTEGCYRAEGLDVAWPRLAELAWLAPARFVTLANRLGDHVLDALRRQFDAEFTGSGGVEDFSRFSAWLMVARPALAKRLREARVHRHVNAQRAASTLWQILDLERQGRQHELVEYRKTLRNLHTGLYADYMRTR
jgi:hypothetical protein